MNLESEMVGVVINVKSFGAKGDGVTDDTKAIQSAINSIPNGGRVLIPNGTYIINAETPLTPLSNQTISLSRNAKLKAKPNPDASYQIINIVEKENVIIEGGFIEGERYEHIGNTGEAGMGISIVKNSKNIIIRNTHISKCWADGIYIGGSLPCYNINIYNVTCNDNRRQGLSIINVDRLTVRDSSFTNTAGKLPECGIDIEPEHYSTVKNVILDNIVCTGNRSGLEVFGWANKVRNVRVLNSNMSNNKDFGLSLAFTSEISVRDSMFRGNKNGILMARDNNNVLFSFCQITDSKNAGVNIETVLQTIDDGIGTKNVVFNSCLFKNNSKNAPNLFDGVVIDNTDKRNIIDRITFNQCDFIDDQDIPTQRFGLKVANIPEVSNVLIGYGNYFKGNATDGMSANANNTFEVVVKPIIKANS